MATLLIPCSLAPSKINMAVLVTPVSRKLFSKRKFSIFSAALRYENFVKWFCPPFSEKNLIKCFFSGVLWEEFLKWFLRRTLRNFVVIFFHHPLCEIILQSDFFAVSLWKVCKMISFRRPSEKIFSAFFAPSSEEIFLFCKMISSLVIFKIF